MAFAIQCLHVNSFQILRIKKTPWVVSLVFLVTAKHKILQINLITRTASDELEMCEYNKTTIIYNKVIQILKTRIA